MNQLPVRIALALVGATSAYAAETATLSGIVRDPSDAAIVGAEVTIRANETGATRHVTTNSSGLFSAPSLQPGVYTVTITAQGFKTVESKDIRLGVAEVMQMNFTMAIGEVSQSVVVEGGTSMINTSDGSVGMTINRDLVANLPLNGRTFQQLIVQAPGVNLSPATSNGGQFTVNGQRPTANYMTIDGASANIGINQFAGGGTIFAGNAAGGTNSLASVDAVEEFRILTSTYAPEYGRSPGGQIIIRTRSGTNDFHGSLFEYFRNDVLDANDWFANANHKPHPPLRFNDFGGVLGGPILRNKTFFFISYEGQQMRQPVFALMSVPSLAARQSAVPATQPILNSFPVPNGPDLGNGQAQFAAGYSNPVTSNATSIRVDHIFGPKITAFARYNHAPSDSIARGGSFAASDLAKNTYLTKTLTAGITCLISPKLVNDLRFNLSDNPIHTAYSLDNFGGAQPISRSLFFVPTQSPFSSITEVFLSYAGGILADGAAVTYEQRQINLVESIDIRLGSHQIKVGFDDRLLLPLVTPTDAVIYSYSGVTTAIANQPSSTTHSVLLGTRGEMDNVSLYAQDTWRIWPRLTATYGIRWEVNSPPRNLRPNNGNYIPFDLSTLRLGSPGSSLWDTQYANVAPRLGIAYQLRQTPGAETVIRGGAGVFYDLGTGYSATDTWIASFPNSLSIAVPGGTFPLTALQITLPSYDLANPPSGQRFTSYPRNLSLPQTWQWNVAIEQSLGRAQMLSISYIAAMGRRLLYQQSYQRVGPQNYTIDWTDNSGNSNYQSLQAHYDRRLRQGLTASASFTWSHALDNLSIDSITSVTPTTKLSARSNWGASDYDVRRTLNAALSYSVPGALSVSWIRVLTRGWGVDSLITARSSLPLTPVSLMNIGFGTYSFRPDVVPGVPLYLSDPNVADGKRINRNAFVINTSGQGNLGRNAVRGFDLVQADVSARRAFRLSERFNLLFRGDLFNIFNHPNFANPNSSLTSGTFGISPSMLNSGIGSSSQGTGLNPLFQVGGPRSVQLSLKLMF